MLIQSVEKQFGVGMSDKERIEILYSVVKELVQRVEFIEERGLRYEEWIDKPSSNFDNLPEKFEELEK